MNNHQYNKENLSGTVTIHFKVLLTFAIIVVVTAMIFHYIGYRECWMDVENISMNMSQERFKNIDAKVESLLVECDVNRTLWIRHMRYNEDGIPNPKLDKANQDSTIVAPTEQVGKTSWFKWWYTWWHKAKHSYHKHPFVVYPPK